MHAFLQRHGDCTVQACKFADKNVIWGRRLCQLRCLTGEGSCPL